MFGGALFFLAFWMMGVAIVAERDEIEKAGEQLASMARCVGATLVAKGQVYLSHDQALAALAEAEKALRFIEAMTITFGEKVITEPVSQHETRMGLANMARAIAEKAPK